MADHNYLLPQHSIKAYIGGKRDYSDRDRVSDLAGTHKLTNKRDFNALMGRKRVSSAKIARFNYQKGFKWDY